MFSVILLTAAISSTAVLSAQHGAAEAPADPAPLVVVELFTSQSCPMCPEANTLLGELADATTPSGEVLALAYGVSYWNLFGWRDEYAQPDFNQRQRAYVDAGEARRVFTPHFIVNGAPELLRYDTERVREAVLAAPAAPAAARLVPADGGGVQLEVSGADGELTVWRVSYTPGEEIASIGGGPNRGKSMSHFNMVSEIAELGAWTPQGGAMPVAPPAEGEALAVLLQDGPGGPIIAAARYPAR